MKIPNVAVFYEQARALKELLVTAAPDPDQMKDLDFLLVVGHLFTLVVYGQLILEQADLIGLDADLVDQIFEVQIRDFSQYAVALHGKPSSTTAQQDWALAAVRRPVTDSHRFDRVWEKVRAYDGAYEMRRLAGRRYERDVVGRRVARPALRGPGRRSESATAARAFRRRRRSRSPPARG